MKKLISPKVWCCLTAILFAFCSCEDKTSDVTYVFKMAYDTNVDAAQGYVANTISFDNIEITVCECAEAEAVEKATQTFNTRLQAIDNDKLNALLSDNGYYTLNLEQVVSETEATTKIITSKTWPTE